jgi:hypothetical protein
MPNPKLDAIHNEAGHSHEVLVGGKHETDYRTQYL